jgi:hypothetical protein
MGFQQTRAQMRKGGTRKERKGTARGGPVKDMVVAGIALGAFRVFLFLFLFWVGVWFGLSSFIESGYSFVFGLLPLTLVSPAAH